MRLYGIRKLSFAAVPVALAAAMLGPMAGPASAAPSLPRQSLCSDWLAWGYYSEMAAEYQEDADDIYYQYHAMGCR